MSAKSCVNLLDPECRNVQKRSLDHGVARNGSSYQINDSSFSGENHGTHFLKKDNKREGKSNGYKSWSENRLLQPAKSTPSLLHIDDDDITNALADLPSGREEMAKFNNDDYMPSNFIGKLFHLGLLN